MGLKKHLIFILPLIFLCLFAMRTFWGSDFYDGHDAQAHIVRLYQYNIALKDGQFPPRWAGGLLAGRGYPVFIFAYPLPYALAETFHLTGFNLAVSLKLTFILAYLTSTIAMYFFAKSYWQSRQAGFLSALLWSYSPFMFLKIFVTASLGVVVSYAFIPIFFLTLFKLLQKPTLRHSLYLSLTASGWVMSHFFTPMIFSPLIAVFILIHFNRIKSKTTIKFLSLAVAVTLALTAWFILPALFELKYTHFADFVTHQYQNHFATFKNLLYSKWGTGAPGFSDNPLSQQVGIAQWLAVVLALITFVLYRLKSVSRKLLPFLITFPLSIFLILKISKPIWDFLPLLAAVHMPWRFLSLSVFTAALSAGFLVKAISQKTLRLAVIGLLIALALFGNRNHLRINEIRVYDQKFFETYTGVATGWNEHLPIWVKDIPKSFPEQKVEVLSGACRISGLTVKSNFKSFSADCTELSILQSNTAYYPGWQIIVDSTDITTQVKENLKSSNGMMRFSLNSGPHFIMIKFQDTPLRQTAKTISFFTGLLVVFLYLKPKVKANHRTNQATK